MTESLPRQTADETEAAFAGVWRRRRASDFMVLVIAAAVVLAGAAIMGGLSWWGALGGVAAIAVFAWVYMEGTAGVERAAMGVAQDAAIIEVDAQLRHTDKAIRAAMVDALPEPAMYIDAHGKVEASNAAARRQFRFLGAEPLLTQVVRRPELLDAVAAARSEGETQVFEFVERDETDRYFSCAAAPVKIGDTTGVLVSMHDLTDIKRAEFARVDFLANASHELRTPLTSLAGFIETMKGPAKDDPAARERFLDIMQSQADRMRRLISDLLSLSRIELIEHKSPEGETDLAIVVAEVGDALAPLAKEKNVKLRVLGPATGVLVAGVRDELTQVVQNLVDNAMKYSEPGGVVEIEILSNLSREEASARVGRRWDEAGHMSIVTAPLNAASQTRYAALRVTDSGEGIDRQHLPRLSERFYRVDQGRGLKPGTGLGLAIVKHVVSRHRGEFLVESEVGKGSAFGVVLPVKPGAAESETQARVG